MTSRRFLTSGLLAVVALAIAAPMAPAKLGTDEKAGLVEIMSSVGNGTRPPASVVTCAANRLQAGTITEVVIDGALADDPNELANSIPFRRIMKSILVCKLPALVKTVNDSIGSGVFTKTQRTCLSNNIVSQMGADESLLTIVIRSGLSGMDFADLSDGDKAVFAIGIAPTIRKCVPARLADVAIVEILQSA